MARIRKTMGSSAYIQRHDFLCFIMSFSGMSIKLDSIPWVLDTCAQDLGDNPSGISRILIHQNS